MWVSGMRTSWRLSFLLRAISLSPSLVQGSNVTWGSGERWRPWGKCVVSRSTRWQMHSSPQSKQIIIVCVMTRDYVDNRALLLAWCGKGLIVVTQGIVNNCLSRTTFDPTTIWYWYTDIIAASFVFVMRIYIRPLLFIYNMYIYIFIYAWNLHL